MKKTVLLSQAKKRSQCKVIHKQNRSSVILTEPNTTYVPVSTIIMAYYIC